MMIQNLPPANSWYNYRTQQYEWLYETPNDLHDYVSQNRSAQALLDLYINHMGLAPLEAAIKVLKAQIGETDDQPETASPAA